MEVRCRRHTHTPIPHASIVPPLINNIEECAQLAHSNPLCKSEMNYYGTQAGPQIDYTGVCKCVGQSLLQRLRPTRWKCCHNIIHALVGKMRSENQALWRLKPSRRKTRSHAPSARVSVVEKLVRLFESSELFIAGIYNFSAHSQVMGDPKAKKCIYVHVDCRVAVILRVWARNAPTYTHVSALMSSPWSSLLAGRSPPPPRGAQKCEVQRP